MIVVPIRIPKFVSDFVEKIYTPAKIGIKNFDLACIYPLDDDDNDVLIAEYWADRVIRLNLNTGDVRWEASITKPLGLDYNDVDGKVAVAYQRGYAVLDVETGERVYDNADGNTWFDVAFDPDNPDILAATRPGSTELRNWKDGTLSASATIGGEGIDKYQGYWYIANADNDTVHKLDASLAQVAILVYPKPRTVRTMRWGVTKWEHAYAIIASKWDLFGYTLILAHMHRGDYAILPFQLEWARASPSLTKVWGCQIYGFKIDLRRVAGVRIPHGHSYQYDVSVPSSGYVRTRPMMRRLQGNKVVIYGKTDQSLEVRLLTFDPAVRTVDPLAPFNNAFTRLTGEDHIQLESVSVSGSFKVVFEDLPELFKIEFYNPNTVAANLYANVEVIS